MRAFLPVLALWLGAIALTLAFMPGGAAIVTTHVVPGGLYTGTVAWAVMIAGCLVLRLVRPGWTRTINKRGEPKA